VITTPGEIVALGAVGLVAMAAVFRTTRGAGRVALGGTLLAAVSASAAAVVPHRSDLEATSPVGAPKAGTAVGYVSSASCLGCHPGEHASFQRTFHRTMTQVARTSTVLAPLDGRALDLDGAKVTLEARGEEVWATLPDPDAVIAGHRAESVSRRVVLTTGSHREQAFWVAGERKGDLRLVPFVWMVKDAVFVPRREAFLLPPGEPMPPVRWASSCIACHAVAGEPRHRLDTDTFDTRAAELGIACEACHGPGGAHVERHRDPIARYTQHASKTHDPTIVQPRSLPPERSAAVCGQCHAYAFPRDEAGWWTDGYSRTFRAGDRLDPSRHLVTNGMMTTTSDEQRVAPVIEASARAIFWPDGAVRVGGREYNGLVESPCYERGEGERKMTCLSCHSMHRGDPAGQIAPDHAGDRGCTSCHGERRAEAHAHHAAGSPGSRCVSCHMPKTSYALLSAVRSHRIDSPSVDATLETGRPNACNLCHLDRPLAWTAEWLATWYGKRSRALPELRARTAVGAYDGIAGDAGVRALIADALGSKEAVTAPALRSSVLAVMRQDPYAAVRRIAERSSRAFADTGDTLDPELLRTLLAARDPRAITIAE
jgi:hypothetical protein